MTSSTTTTGGIAPGASAGTLTIDDSVVLNAASQLAFELVRDSPPGQQTIGSGVNDLLVVASDLTLAGTLDIQELTAGNMLTAQAGDKWRLINYGGSLLSNTLQIEATPPALSSGLGFEIEAIANEINLLVVTTAVPEAGAFAAVGLAGLLSFSAVKIRKRMGRATVDA